MTKENPWRLLFVLSFLLLPCFSKPAFAEVHLPSLIGDNMVIQQGQKVRFWGTANPGEKISVSLAGIQAVAFAENNGNWEVMIGPFKAGGPFDLTLKGANTLKIKNVLIGEVWVCSGQSNMEWPLIN